MLFESTTNPVDVAWGAERARLPHRSAPRAPRRARRENLRRREDRSKSAAIASKKEADALVVSPLDEVAWLFNVRGNDLDFNPVALGYGLVGKDTATLYVDEAKVTAETRSAHLAEGGVDVAAVRARARRTCALAAAGKAPVGGPDKVSVALVAAAEESRGGRARAKAGEEGEARRRMSSRREVRLP